MGDAALTNGLCTHYSLSVTVASSKCTLLAVDDYAVTRASVISKTRQLADCCSFLDNMPKHAMVSLSRDMSVRRSVDRLSSIA